MSARSTGTPIGPSPCRQLSVSAVLGDGAKHRGPQYGPLRVGGWRFRCAGPTCRREARGPQSGPLRVGSCQCRRSSVMARSTGDPNTALSVSAVGGFDAPVQHVGAKHGDPNRALSVSAVVSVGGPR
ncbi:hypothetical protein NN561_004824 [Cricetulus griseus]